MASSKTMKYHHHQHIFDWNYDNIIGTTIGTVTEYYRLQALNPGRDNTYAISWCISWYDDIQNLRCACTHAHISTCTTLSERLTGPLDLIGVPQVFWGSEKHLSIGHRRPEWNHIESPVVPNRSILLRVYYFTCRKTKDLSNQSSVWLQATFCII